MEIRPVEAVQGESQHDRPTWQKVSATLAAGVIALGAIGTVAYNVLEDRSGELTSFDPNHEVTPKVNGELNVASWNMENKAAMHFDDILGIIEKYGIDAFLLQEVSYKDLQAMGNDPRFDGLYIRGVTADIKAGAVEGTIEAIRERNIKVNSGTANVIITRQKPEDTQAVSVKGNSVGDALGKIFTGAVDTLKDRDSSAKEIVEATDEDRAIIGLTIKVATPDGETADVRILNTHSSGNRASHDRHIDEDMAFAKENIQEGRTLIMGGDFNSPYGALAEKAGQVGLITSHTGPTTVGSAGNPPKEIDKILQEANSEDHLKFGEGRVLRVTKTWNEQTQKFVVKEAPKTDHRILLWSADSE